MLWRSVFFTGFLVSMLAIIIPNIVWLTSWLIAKLWHVRVSYTPFMWVTLLLLFLAWGMVFYGNKYGRFQSVVNHITYSSPHLPPSFKGYKIVHISDLHLDSFQDVPNAYRTLTEEINQQNADLIIFTGDMSTMGMSAPLQFEDMLKSMHAKDGVISVLGNHDFFIYEHKDRRKCLQAADSLTRFQREHLGWKVLRNESVIMHRGNDSIAIAGVDNINGNQGFKTIQQGDLKKATQGIQGLFTILLTHDPSHWQAEVLPQTNIEITLSGHTHAGQLRIGSWSLANFAFKQCDGMYMHQNRMLYVNSGIGCTVPFRFHCPSEITVLTLQ